MILINSIHHIAVTARDLEKSVSFYKNIFGFEDVQRFEHKDLDYKGAFLRLGNTHLELLEFNNSIEPKDDLANLKIIGLRHIALSVSNLEESCSVLKSKVEISEPILGSSGKKLCFLKDPNGVIIELYESNQK